MNRPLQILSSPLRWHHARRALALSLRPALMPLADLYRRRVMDQTRVVAVVGSFGKTTAARALKAALWGEHDPQSNWNPESGVALDMLRTRAGQRWAVYEAGVDGPGRMERFAQMIRPDVALVTSIGSEHNRAFRSLDATQKEKGAMVEALPTDGLAVLNGDCPRVLSMKDRSPARTVTFGFEEHNDLRCTAMGLHWPPAMQLQLRGFGQSAELRLPLVGWPMAQAILGASAVALAEGISMERVKTRLEAFTPTIGRLQPVKLPLGAWLLRDEFKASLETVDAALDTLEAIPAPRRLVVLGEVFQPPKGQVDQEQLYHRLGARVAGVASDAIFIGAKEYGRTFRRGAEGTGSKIQSVTCVDQAFPDVLQTLPRRGPGDLVLLKGRTEQRLERIALALMGRRVRCRVRECTAAVSLPCRRCKLLERNRGG